MTNTIPELQQEGEVRVLIDCSEKVKSFGEGVIDSFYQTDLADFHPGFIELATNITLSFAVVPGNRQATIEVIAGFIKNIREGFSTNIIDVFFDTNSTPNFKLNSGSIIKLNYISEPELLDSIALVNDNIHRNLIQMKSSPSLEDIKSATVFQVTLGLIRANLDRISY